MVRAKDSGGSALEQLREFGLRYPGAHTKSPWPGHLDLAVNDKTFAYLSLAGEPLTISCKLPRSGDAALSLPFSTPTAYGLGKSGWVTATFPDGTPVPVELLEEWIDESYRAQAPKRLSAGLSATSADGGPAPARRQSTVKQKASALATLAPAAARKSKRRPALSTKQGAGARSKNRASAGPGATQRTRAKR